MQAKGRSPAQARMPVRSSIESAGGLHPYNDDDEESQGESRIRAGCWDKHGYLAPEESRRAGNPHSHKSLSMIHDVGWQSPSAAERDKFLKHVCFLSESSAGKKLRFRGWSVPPYALVFFVPFSHASVAT